MIGDSLKVAAITVALAATASGGCTANRPPSGAAVVVSEDTNLRAQKWAEVIGAASKDPRYGGFERTADALYVGFTSEASVVLASITDRDDVLPFTARYPYAAMQAEADTAAGALASAGIGFIAVAPDYRSGRLLVTDVENAQKQGLFRCSELTPLPASIQGVTLPLVDDRECVR